MSVAFVFPGQGSQTVGMGRDLYESSPAACAIFDQADAILGFPLTRLCFEGPEDGLTATENAQPALLVTGVAVLAALAGSTGDLPAFVGSKAQMVAGHSLGEYTALVASGALGFDTAVRLVRRRGELMAEARDGVMAAIIGLNEEPLEAVCRESSSDDELVVVANYNSPGQLVISGATPAVMRAVELARQRGARRALPLKVSAAFHSPLMQAAAAGLAQAIASASVRDGYIPVISNVAAEPLAGAEAIRTELVAQVTAPVRWIATIERMAAAGIDTFVEIGAGSVLSGLIKRIAPTARTLNVSDMAGVRAYIEGQ